MSQRFATFKATNSPRMIFNPDIEDSFDDKCSLLDIPTKTKKSKRRHSVASKASKRPQAKPGKERKIGRMDSAAFDEEFFDNLGLDKVSIESVNTKQFQEAATQTCDFLCYDEMMQKAEREWQNCMTTTIKLKFENLRAKHQLELQALMQEIKTERNFRQTQCRKVFEQWKEDITLQCTLETSIKLPSVLTHDNFSFSRQSEKVQLIQKKEEMNEKELIKMEIQKRLRGPGMYLECEPAFASRFQLVSEFTDKYKYYMEGKLKDIQSQLQLLKTKLDAYVDKFPKKHGSAAASGVGGVTSANIKNMMDNSQSNFAFLERIPEDTLQHHSCRPSLEISKVQSQGRISMLDFSTHGSQAIGKQKQINEKLGTESHTPVPERESVVTRNERGKLQFLTLGQLRATQKMQSSHNLARPKQQLTLPARSMGGSNNNYGNFLSAVNSKTSSMATTPKVKSPALRSPVRKYRLTNSRLSNNCSTLKSNKSQRHFSQKLKEANFRKSAAPAIVSPSAFVGNKQAKEVKLKLLLKKNFDLTDERIGRELKRFSDQAFEQAGYVGNAVPSIQLPATSIFKSNKAVSSAQESRPPLIRKGMRRQDSLDRLMEEPGENLDSSHSDFVLETEEADWAE